MIFSRHLIKKVHLVHRRVKARTTSFKCLGVTMDERGGKNAQLGALKTTAKYLTCKMGQLKRSIACQNTEALLTVVAAKVMPALTYGAMAFKDSLYEWLGKQQYICYQHIFALPDCSSQSQISLEFKLLKQDLILWAKNYHLLRNIANGPNRRNETWGLLLAISIKALKCRRSTKKQLTTRNHSKIANKTSIDNLMGAQPK